MSIPSTIIACTDINYYLRKKDVLYFLFSYFLQLHPLLTTVGLIFIGGEGKNVHTFICIYKCVCK